MRIRKRQVPLPLSSLSPIPLSDPHFSQSPMVQLQLLSNPYQNLHQQPRRVACLDSKPFNQRIGLGSNGMDCSDDAVLAEEEKTNMLEKDERVLEGERSNDTRKRGLVGEEMRTKEYLTPSSSCINQGVGSLGEWEKAFPVKKRRGSFERRSTTDERILEKDDNKMKLKTNYKKYAIQNDNNQEENKEIIIKECVDGSTSVTTTSAKKKARGGALVEGSRCSRVNGRGWRCCQQTLIGYSLCEHHLGKGRLRSMTNVRSRSAAAASAAAMTKGVVSSKPLLSSPSVFEKETKRVGAVSDTSKLVGEQDHGDGDAKQPLMIPKKKMKIGMVKARSISSLLGQANNAIAVSEDGTYLDGTS